MKERPIIFSGAMVKAILDGRKSQTRRVVKLTKDEPLTNVQWGYTAFTPPNCISLRGIHANKEYGESFIRNPYGKVGDHLWVRESVFLNGWYDGMDADLPIYKVNDNEGSENTVLYKADYPDLRAIDGDGFQKYRKDGSEASPKWTPSIHMPRWASRIMLEITDVRVERLQDISEEDAEAEGVEMAEVGALTVIPDSWITNGRWMPSLTSKSYRAGCAVMWDKINGKRGYGWASNPWVWVISFRKI